MVTTAVTAGSSRDSAVVVVAETAWKPAHEQHVADEHRHDGQVGDDRQIAARLEARLPGEQQERHQQDAAEPEVAPMTRVGRQSAADHPRGAL